VDRRQEVSSEVSDESRQDHQMTKRSILIVAPHPDDETLGCGGVLAKRIEEGCDVAVVVLTDGCNLFRLSRWRIEVDPTPAQASAMRKEETRRAVGILGGRPEAIRFLDVEDAALERHVEFASQRIAGIIADVDPDEVYVTSQHEEHPDHVAACAAVRSAIRETHSHATVYRYIISLRPGLSLSSIPEPSVSIDITGQLERKRKAVSQFASHLTIVAKGQGEPFFKNTDKWLGPSEVFLVDPAPRSR
jgi:LmbE family N-acetylglucosaminyl deacetylase